MKTMHRASTTTIVTLGALTGMAATGLAALTNTGVSGTYAFAVLGLLAVGTFLMWPERTRFRTDHSSTPAQTRGHRQKNSDPSQRAL